MSSVSVLFVNIAESYANNTYNISIIQVAMGGANKALILLAKISVPMSIPQYFQNCTHDITPVLPFYSACV